MLFSTPPHVKIYILSSIGTDNAIVRTICFPKRTAEIDRRKSKTFEYINTKLDMLKYIVDEDPHGVKIGGNRPVGVRSANGWSRRSSFFLVCFSARCPSPRTARLVFLLNTSKRYRLTMLLNQDQETDWWRQFQYCSYLAADFRSLPLGVNKNRQLLWSYGTVWWTHGRSFEW